MKNQGRSDFEINQMIVNVKNLHGKRSKKIRDLPLFNDNYDSHTSSIDLEPVTSRILATTSNQQNNDYNEKHANKKWEMYPERYLIPVEKDANGNKQFRTLKPMQVSSEPRKLSTKKHHQFDIKFKGISSRHLMNIDSFEDPTYTPGRRLKIYNSKTNKNIPRYLAEKSSKEKLD